VGGHAVIKVVDEKQARQKLPRVEGFNVKCYTSDDLRNDSAKKRRPKSQNPRSIKFKFIDFSSFIDLLHHVMRYQKTRENKESVDSKVTGTHEYRKRPVSISQAYH
jgi:hypothetical protein